MRGSSYRITNALHAVSATARLQAAHLAFPLAVSHQVVNREKPLSAPNTCVARLAWHVFSIKREGRAVCDDPPVHRPRLLRDGPVTLLRFPIGRKQLLGQECLRLAVGTPWVPGGGVHADTSEPHLLLVVRALPMSGWVWTMPPNLGVTGKLAGFDECPE